jgi:hypothetical protein
VSLLSVRSCTFDLCGAHLITPPLLPIVCFCSHAPQKVLCEQLENPSGVAPVTAAGEDEKALDAASSASASAGTNSKAPASEAAAIAMAQAAVSAASASAAPASASAAGAVAPPNRCRVLKGVDPEPEQLAAKIEVLEERWVVVVWCAEEKEVSIVWCVRLSVG